MASHLGQRPVPSRWGGVRHRCSRRPGAAGCGTTTRGSSMPRHCRWTAACAPSARTGRVTWFRMQTSGALCYDATQVHGFTLQDGRTGSLPLRVGWCRDGQDLRCLYHAKLRGWVRGLLGQCRRCDGHAVPLAHLRVSSPGWVLRPPGESGVSAGHSRPRCHSRLPVAAEAASCGDAARRWLI